MNPGKIPKPSTEPNSIIEFESKAENESENEFKPEPGEKIKAPYTPKGEPDSYLKPDPKPRPLDATEDESENVRKPEADSDSLHDINPEPSEDKPEDQHKDQYKDESKNVRNPKTDLESTHDINPEPSEYE